MSTMRLLPVTPPPEQRDAFTTCEDVVPSVDAGFPLASLASMIAAFAVALVSIDFQEVAANYNWLIDEYGVPQFAPVLGMGLFGAIVGFLHLFAYKFRWGTLMIAVMSGAIAGQLGLVILLGQGPVWRTLLAIGVFLAATTVLRISAE
jgi:hypothetical protein